VTVQVSAEGPQCALLTRRAVSQTAAQRDVVLDQTDEEITHDVASGHGRATSRNAATSTAA
jgi:hypothetical protein